MPGILDAMLNPFAQSHNSGDYYAGADKNAVPRTAMPQSAPAMAPAQAPSRNPMAAASSVVSGPAGRRYNPLTDPEGPLARRTVLGALFATGPSRTEYLDSIEQERKRAIGASRGQAYKKLAELVQQPGMDPQKAFLSFINTPEGMEFIINDPDPNEAVAEFMKLGTQEVDPVIAARQSVFGQVGVTPQHGPQAVDQPIMAGTGAPAVVSPDAAGATAQVPTGPKVGDVDMEQLPPGITSDQLRGGYDAQGNPTGALALLLLGDEEGARLALTMAEQLDKQAAANSPMSTDDIKEYEYYKAAAEKRGEKPMTETDWWSQMKRSSSPRGTPEEELAKARSEALIDVDKAGAKAAADTAMAASRALPALEAASRIAGNVKGGYAGAVTPYLQRIAASFGLEVEGGSDAELMNAISMQLIPLVRQPGQVSNYEQQTYQQAVPSLLQSEAGRRKIIDVMQRQAKKAQEIARVYRENIGDPALMEKLAALDTPMFTPEELAEFKQAGTPQPDANAEAETNEDGFVAGDIREGSGGKRYRFKGGRNIRENWEPIE